MQYFCIKHRDFLIDHCGKDIFLENTIFFHIFALGALFRDLRLARASCIMFFAVLPFEGSGDEPKGDAFHVEN